MMTLDSGSWFKGLLGAIVFAAITNARASTTFQYYLPSDPALAREKTRCGVASQGYAYVPLGRSIHATFVVAPSNDSVSVNVFLALAEAETVRFIEPEIEIEVPSLGKKFVAPLTGWETTILDHGVPPGRVEVIAAGALLAWHGKSTTDPRGLGKEQFHSRAILDIGVHADEIIVKIPRIEVGGVVVEAQQVPMRLQTKIGPTDCGG